MATLSGERHYFGFGIRNHLEEVARSQPCQHRRCGQRPTPFLLDYAYVRERDQHPTYVCEAACQEHAQQFADSWGLEVPRDRAA